MTLVFPDHVAACRALLRGNAITVHPDVAALVAELRATYIPAAGNIEAFISSPDRLPYNAIKISAAGGTGSLPDAAGCRHRRVQFDCYGATVTTAAAIAEIVGLIFEPVDDRQQGFTAEHTRVVATIAVTGPLPGVDPDAKRRTEYRTVTVDLNVFAESVP